jgi:hypothetical protein
MITRLLASIADTLRHRFGRLFRREAKPDEYLERYDETRGRSAGRHDARAASGHFWGNPDGGNSRRR